MGNVIPFASTGATSPLTTTAHTAAVNATAAQGALVNGCCTAILEQADISVPDMPSLGQHQQTTRDHANYWINSVQPTLIASIGAVVGFSNQYNAFLVPLMQAAPNVNTDPTAKNTVVQGLQLLKQSVTTYGGKTTSATSAVDSFRSSFTSDYSAFDSDITAMNTKLTGLSGDGGEIKQLTDKISAEQDAMSKDLSMIAGGATMMVVGGLMIAVGALAEIPTAGASTALIVAGGVVVVGGAILTGFGGSDYRSTLAQYKQDVEQLAADNAEVTLLTHVSGQITSMNTQINTAVSALNAMEAAWQNLGTEFDTLLTAVNGTDVDSAFLQAQLQTAGTDWNDMATQAAKVQSMIDPPQVPLSMVLQNAA
ncbi:MAG TPA: HBL/NHE enterotoxin family protein [Allosphingosinicella sp.]|nr:HBL/NHE enterotoxin family protein [Allosphingosinicella sp.]